MEMYLSDLDLLPEPFPSKLKQHQLSEVVMREVPFSL